jgi:hypothetical protein
VYWLNPTSRISLDLRITLENMDELLARRRSPFAVALAVSGILCLAILRLPDTFVENLGQDGPLNASQADWAFRLLAVFAILQILYGAYFVLRVERVGKARVDDPKVARMTRLEIMTSLSRNAAGMVFLTVVYGVAAFVATGLRGGFWLFPGMALAQAAWYYRQLGEIGRWLVFQEEPVEDKTRAEWRREPPDYAPPIARGLEPAGDSSN